MNESINNALKELEEIHSLKKIKRRNYVLSGRYKMRNEMIKQIIKARWNLTEIKKWNKMEYNE